MSLTAQANTKARKYFDLIAVYLGDNSATSMCIADACFNAGIQTPSDKGCSALANLWNWTFRDEYNL